MFRNHINPIVFCGFLALLLGLFCFALITEIYQENAWRLHDLPKEAIFFISTLLVVGLFSTISGLGLILRKGWAKLMATVALGLLLFAWLGFIYFAYSRGGFRQTPFMLTATALLVASGIVFFILLLNNPHLSDHYDKPMNLEENKRDDLLDH